MSDSSSCSSNTRSDMGGVPLCSPPRRKPSNIAQQQEKSNTSKNSSHKNSQQNLRSAATPAPKAQQQEAGGASPFHHQTPAQFFKPGHAKMQTPSYSTSESSSAPGYGFPPGRYGGYPGGGHMALRTASSGFTGSRLDSVTSGMVSMDLKLIERHKEANRCVRQVQEQILQINQALYQQAGLPPQFAQQMDAALKELSQDVGRLGALVDGVRLETGKKEAEFQRIQATAGMQAVEIEGLRSEIDTTKMKLSAAEKNNEEVQGTYQAMLLSYEQQNKQMRKELEAAQKQLQGSRPPFYPPGQDVEAKENMINMMSEGDYREKARIIQHLIDADPQDKFKILDILMGNNGAAPTRSVSYQPNTMAIQSIGSSTPASEAAWSRPPSRMTPQAPVMPGRRTPSSAYQGGNSIVRPASSYPGNNRLSQPRSRPSTGHGHRNNHRQENSLALYKFEDTAGMYDNRSPQEFGSPQPSRARQAVVAQAQMEWDAQIAQWKSEFGKVFSMVHGWTSRYASQVKPFQAASLPTDAPRLWDYMTDMLYPDQPEAGASHAAFLLEDPVCRQYFVERIMLQYIVTNILSVEAWTEHDPDSDRELRELKERLDHTEVFKSYIRQGIVDKMGSVVGRILDDDDFAAYRAGRVNFHQQRLKTIVGPLMDAESSRQEAGYDLHNVASAGLQASAMMFQSRLNFEFHWSTTCAKFSVDHHEVLGMDQVGAVDPVLLQQKQYRIKLVVTPTILFRDDRGVSINPKRVARSQVFVMN